MESSLKQMLYKNRVRDVVILTLIGSVITSIMVIKSGRSEHLEISEITKQVILITLVFLGCAVSGVYNEFRYKVSVIQNFWHFEKLYLPQPKKLSNVQKLQLRLEKIPEEIIELIDSGTLTDKEIEAL